MIELEFHDVTANTSSTFDPEVAYANFKRIHTNGLNYDHIRIFYIKGREIKTSLAKRSEWEVTLNLGGWKISVYNTKFPGNRNNPVPDDGLTLHRLSGFLARYLLEKMLKVSEPEKLIIKSKIINPLAEKNGITWYDGEEVYLSFFPGSEMCLGTQDFYPMAIEFYQVQRKEMEPKFLEKTLKQRSLGLEPSTWTISQLVKLQSALTVVSGLGWKKTNVGAAARNFLAKFGINM
uniref:Nucleoprotein n=1 Tax=Ilesha virus TaxID=273341 RepID=A5CKD8_9VIRU|nr:nucleocapsid protein [Ilesha virus]